jgi:hypothetical protein
LLDKIIQALRENNCKNILSSKALLKPQGKNKDHPRQEQVKGKGIHVHQVCITKNTQRNNKHGTE